MEKKQENVEVECIIKVETPKAWRIIVEGKEEWVPKSLCSFEPNVGTPKKGKMTMPEWIAIEKEFV